MADYRRETRDVCMGMGYGGARKLALTPSASAVPSYIHNEIKISMNVLVTSVAISSI